MSAPFVSSLRSGPSPIQIGASGPGTITIRVAASDIWETVRVVTSPETSVAEVRERVVRTLFQHDEHVDEFVLKFRGWEMLDASASLAAAGVVDGSILLLALRRRRPVR